MFRRIRESRPPNRARTPSPCGDQPVWGWARVGTGAFARPAKRSEASATTTLECHGQLRQVLTQLLQALHLDRMHAQLGGAFQVQGAIVNEAALVRGDLRDFQRQPIDVALRLAESNIAGTHKQSKDLPHAELFNALVV